MSLVVHLLHELRERRPVSLLEESLVELVGQGGPPLLRWGMGRLDEPSLDVVDGLQGFGGGSSRVGVPILHLCEQGLPNHWGRYVEAGADGLTAFIQDAVGRAASSVRVASRWA